MPVRVTSNRDNLSRLILGLRELQARKVRIGWAAGDMHPSDDGKTPVSLATIARTVNFGRPEGVTATGVRYPAIPPRNFMQLTMQRNSDELKSLVNNLFVALQSGKINAEQFLKMCGVFWVSKIRETMEDSPAFVALSDATIKARKKRHPGMDELQASRPLLETRTLQRSLAAKVVNA